MYFILQRISTFLVGLVFVGIGLFIWMKDGGGTSGITIGFALFISLGVYFIIASIVPHRNTSEAVGDEVLGRMLIEFPLRLIGKVLGRISDIF